MDDHFRPPVFSLQLPVKEALNALSMALCTCPFILTIVPNSDLDDLLYLLDLECIPHDTGMGILQAFKVRSQIHMGIDLQEAKGCVVFRQGLKKA